MLRQLPADCLREVFEFFEKDKFTLHSCLLVNRLWCEISVRILWRNVWNFKQQLKIFNTLMACLPNESKGILYENGIFTSKTSKPPLFNYASFCKVLSIREIHIMINIFLKNNQYITSRNNEDLIMQELLKMFMNQISSLRKVTYYLNSYGKMNIPNNITFIHLPGAKACLTNLSELSCNSSIDPKIFYQLSQICHNIKSLVIRFRYTVSDELNDLIFSQNCLKYLSLIQPYDDLFEILPSLTKHSNTLIKLKIEEEYYRPISFITKFTNLQELVFKNFQEFNDLENVILLQLRILKFCCGCPDVEIMIQFLENNGKNLKEFYVDKCDSSLNLAIAKFCPNLKSLFTLFNEVETLKVIFNNCQQLESIRIWCGDIYLREKEMLEIVAKYSPKNFYKLKLYNYIKSGLLLTDLESFFINWKNRIPQKSLSFISINNLDRNMKIIIEKYKKLGIIKKFKIVKFKVEEFYI